MPINKKLSQDPGYTLRVFRDDDYVAITREHVIPIYGSWPASIIFENRILGDTHLTTSS